MAELKRNFLKSRMNKDDDERLVKNGEYRDALNVEVSSSEGADSGSVETLTSNKIAEKQIEKSPNSITVGTFTDQENNCVYNLVEKASDFSTSISIQGTPVFTGTRSDMIEKISFNDRNKVEKTEVVINDVYEVRHSDFYDQISRAKIRLYYPTTRYSLPLVEGSSYNYSFNIRPGMRVQAIGLDNYDLWGVENKIIVTKISPVSSGISGLYYIDVEISGVPDGTPLYDSALRNSGVVLKFTSERILNFSSGATSEKEINTDLKQSTKTPESSLITAINIVDDYLFFTDGRTEPKKININRSILGNAQSYLSASSRHHTHLICRIKSKNYSKGFLKETHITTIKKFPTEALQVEVDISGSNVANSNVPLTSKPGGPGGTWALFDFWQVNDAGEKEFIGVNSVIYLKPGTAEMPSWKINDVISINNSSANQFLVRIDTVYSNSFRTVVVKQDDSYYSQYENTSVQNIPQEAWTGTLLSDSDLYSNDFVRFAYRYKYTDNEVSCISPYSKVAFYPGSYSYDGKNGFNLGMQNNVGIIKIKDINKIQIPADVKSIELLFKVSSDANVYAFEELAARQASAHRQTQNSLFNTYNSGAFRVEKNEIIINSELFGYTVAEDQLSRITDLVPKSAVGQEVTANRLMYANYKQGYDIKDSNNESIKIDPLMGSETVPVSFTSVINSGNSVKAFSSTDNSHGDTAALFTQDGTLVNYEDSNGNQLYVSGGLKLNNEIFDSSASLIQASGGAYTHFKAPASGTYTFKASVKARIMTKSRGVQDHNEPIYLQNWEDSGGNYTGDYVPRRYSLAIVKCDSNGKPLASAFNTPSQNIHTSFFDNTTTGFAGNGFDFGGSPPTGAPADGLAVYQFPDFEDQLVSFENFSLNIAEDDRYCLVVMTDEPYAPIMSVDPGAQFVDATFEITHAPTVESSLYVHQGFESIKSERTYHVGIVYGDGKGRETPVLISENNDFTLAKRFSKNKNAIFTNVRNNAPHWAKYYKVFIKESAKKYHNLVLDSALLNNDSNSAAAWLIFNDSDKNKIVEGQYLTLKKLNESNTAVTDVDSRWKILSYAGGLSFEGGNLTVGDEVFQTSVITESSEIVGKVAAKVYNNSKLQSTTSGLGNLLTTPIVNASNGAVFETELVSSVEEDLYYEASDAYPIYLTEETVRTYIKLGSKVTFEAIEYDGNIPSEFMDVNQTPLVVTQVRGARAIEENDYINSGDFENKCRLEFDDPFNVDAGIYISSTDRVLVKIHNKNGTYVSAYLMHDFHLHAPNYMYLDPVVHPTPFRPNNSCPVLLPWHNCYSFGNGVESDTIRDDFNATEIFPYTASGKVSGFKANLPVVEHEEVVRKNNITYSELYNENVDDNRLSEFLEKQIKQLNPTYGSIQKLYSRDEDLVVLCENKCLQIFVNKDMLYNADGNVQLVAGNNILGQTRPFSGDYGISKNPESFAKDEYRAYFADKARGAVLRLSKDGLTAISDAGMKDWFRDHLAKSKAIIGSFDSRKEEYNITLHEIVNPTLSKNVYTVSFDESINGWVSFKSFIQEAGLTINNKYYTFKKGLMYEHHAENVETQNTFYGYKYNSTITPLFNDSPSSIKSIETISYEGSQAKINKFSTVNVDGISYTDGEYYNIKGEDGWSVEYIKTDAQEGQVSEFIKKENKWFNYVNGVKTVFVNSFDGPGESNVDLAEFSSQGLGSLTKPATMIGGDAEPTQGYKLEVINGTEDAYLSWNEEDTSWYSDGLTLYNINSLPTSSTFNILPKPGHTISSGLFDDVEGGVGDLYNSITFSNVDDYVVATINWTTHTMTQDVQVFISVVQNAVLRSTDIASTSIVINLEEPENLESAVGVTTFTDESMADGGAVTSAEETGSFTIESVVFSTEPAYIITVGIEVTEGQGYFDQNNLFSLSVSGSSEDSGTYTFQYEYIRDLYDNIYKIHAHVFYQRVIGQVAAAGTNINLISGNLIDYFVNSNAVGGPAYYVAEQGADYEMPISSNLPSVSLEFSENWIYHNEYVASTGGQLFFSVNNIPVGETRRTATITIKDPEYQNTMGTINIIQDDDPHIELSITVIPDSSTTTAGKIIASPSNYGTQLHRLELQMDTGTYLSDVNTATTGYEFLNQAGTQSINWITLANDELFEPTVAGQDIGKYYGYFYVADNNTTVDRVAMIKVHHPTTGQATVTVTQDGAYNSSTHHIEISVEDSIFAIDSSYTMSPASASGTHSTVNLKFRLNDWNPYSYYNMKPFQIDWHPTIQLTSGPYNDPNDPYGQGQTSDASYLGAVEGDSSVIVTPNYVAGQTYQYEKDLLIENNAGLANRTFYVRAWHPENPNTTASTRDAILNVTQQMDDTIYGWLDSNYDPELSIVELHNLTSNFDINIAATGAQRTMSIVTNGSTPTVGFWSTSGYSAITPGTDYNGFSINQISSLAGAEGNITTYGLTATYAANNTNISKANTIGIWHSNSSTSNNPDVMFSFIQAREPYVAADRPLEVLDVNGNPYVGGQISQQSGVQAIYFRVGDYTEADFNAETSPYPATNKRPFVEIYNSNSSGEVLDTADEGIIPFTQNLIAEKNPNWLNSSGFGPNFLTDPLNRISSGGGSYSNGVTTVTPSNNGTVFFAPTNGSSLWARHAKDGQTIVLSYTIDSNVSSIASLSLYPPNAWIDSIVLSETVLPSTAGTHSVTLNIDGYNFANESRNGANQLAFRALGASSGTPTLSISNVSIKATAHTHRLVINHNDNPTTELKHFKLYAFHNWNNLTTPNSILTLIKRPLDAFDWTGFNLTLDGNVEFPESYVIQGIDQLSVFAPTTQATFSINATATSAPYIRFVDPDNQNTIISTDYPSQVVSFKKETEAEDGSITTTTHSVSSQDHFLIDTYFKGGKLIFDVEHTPEITQQTRMKLVAFANSPLTNIADLTNGGSGIDTASPNSSNSEATFTQVNSTNFKWNNHLNLDNAGWAYKKIKVKNLDASKKYRISYKIINWTTTDHPTLGQINTEAKWLSIGTIPDNYCLTISNIDYVNGVELNDSSTNYSNNILNASSVGNGSFCFIVSPKAGQTEVDFICRDNVSFALQDLRVENVSDSNALSKGANIASLTVDDMYTITQYPPSTTTALFLPNPEKNDSPLYNISSNFLVQANASEATMTSLDGSFTIKIEVNNSVYHLRRITDTGHESIVSSDIINTTSSFSVMSGTIANHTLYFNENNGGSDRDLVLGIYQNLSDASPTQIFTVTQQG